MIAFFVGLLMGLLIGTFAGWNICQDTLDEMKRRHIQERKDSWDDGHKVATRAWAQGLEPRLRLTMRAKKIKKPARKR